MKLPFLLALGSASFVLQAQAAPNSFYKYATSQLEHIQTLTQNLTDAIKAWDGSDLQTALSNIHEPSDSTTKYIGKATEGLKKQGSTFDVTQSFRIASPTQRLAYAVNASVATLIRRVEDFNSADIGTIVITDLESLLDASEGFSKALIDCVPTSLKPVGNSLKGQIVDSLTQGIDCFKGKKSNCIKTIADTTRTYDLAVKYNAMKKDGSPIT